ncbi:hypothetical protein Intca_3093 [Intrasporangium calvum DSM 43043]|uniref:Uncharacterized protein n=2 Tax=Intrasporangium calvum TaxID=53358 RepID=E6SC39_INTC7|nr:hypothetical protein Intca_3093 [Intrasporangium calvum DSM 43043]
MVSLSTGGGSSAVAASAHAGCERFRKTDPMIIGMSRRKAAAHLGYPDTSAGIPEARWMRAMTFERLVRDQRFVSPLLTTAIGRLGLPRPTVVSRRDGKVSVPATALALEQAHLQAVHEDVATLITSLALPFVGLESEPAATPVKPDFAVVAPRRDPATDRVVGTWLVMGDAKDYERVRSRIGDQRMLKGFLQVALGAESAAAWSKLPKDMVVHRHGALAVPRNAFLQPEAVIEDLKDHRAEVMARVAERNALLAGNDWAVLDIERLCTFVGHLAAEYDPNSCAACSMFTYCRDELRSAHDPQALLIELGIRRELRPALRGVVDGSGVVGRVPESVVAAVRATLRGMPLSSGQRRIDPAGVAGSVNVVLAKSDAAALGVHGVAIQRVRKSGKPTRWSYHTFDEPQSPATRLALMELLGEVISTSMADLEDLIPGAPSPLHIVVPDQVTCDVLVSIADSLAGVETSRLRWKRDLEMGRPALTFDGEPATVPAPLTAHQRLAVSFLLEEDRARAMKLRTPFVNLRDVVARHLVAGGPMVDSGRLDYLVRWATATVALDHRAVSDKITASDHTPGARLSNARSDAIHQARGRPRGSSKRADKEYAHLVTEELRYKTGVVDSAIAHLNSLPTSRLREVYRALEGDAQQVWRRRLRLHASDLVRFGRTAWWWRNNQVDMLDADAACLTKLQALGNPQVARDLGADAGTREIALATVAGLNPIRLDVRSRRMTAGTHIVALHVNERLAIEGASSTLKIQAGSFKFGKLAVGELTASQADDPSLEWSPRFPPTLVVGDELVVADVTWLGGPFASRHEIAVARPGVDGNSAPKAGCTEHSYSDDPDGHQYCCRPHEAAEADTSDWIAERREKGEMNPQAWPPVIDTDQFDTPADGTPTDGTSMAGETRPNEDMTIDDLD